MLLKFHFKYLHVNSLRNFFHYRGEMKPGLFVHIPHMPCMLTNQNECPP